MTTEIALRKLFLTPNNRGKYTFSFIVFLLSLSFSAHAQEYKTFVAKSGDTIFQVLSDNKLPPGKYFDTFRALNSSKLGKNDQLLKGVKYRLPKEDEFLKYEPKPKVQNDNKQLSNSLYGSHHKNFTKKSNELAGTVYYLVSGHGGPDPGAMSTYNGHDLCEDEYAYDVTLRLSRELEARGAKVYMIIQDSNDGIRDDKILDADNDEVCYPNLSIPLDQVQRLKQRTQAVNKLYRSNKGKFQRLVITHIDSRSKGKNIDVFFYHDQRSTGGKKLANELQNTFKSKYAKHQPSRGYNGTVSSRNLYVLKNTLPVATFIELGNINHTRDRLRFMTENNRQALANWLCEGLINDYKKNGHNK